MLKIGDLKKKEEWVETVYSGHSLNRYWLRWIDCEAEEANFEPGRVDDEHGVSLVLTWMKREYSLRLYLLESSKKKVSPYFYHHSDSFSCSWN